MKKRPIDIREKHGKHGCIVQRIWHPVKAVAVIFLSILSLVSCSQKSISDSCFVLGTVATITINGTSDESIISDAFDLLYSIDGEISRFTEGSWIYRINEKAGKEAVEIPSDVFLLVESAVEMAERTGGTFNPAIGPLSSLWGIGTPDAKVPSDTEIAAVLPLLDWHDVVLDPLESTAFLTREGMALDLGGVGKGWAADKLRDFLISRGVESALINLGGCITVIGDNQGRPWRIGIQTPFAASGEYFTIVTLSDGESLVTSGGYQRYIEKDGIRYHHILSSESGYPYRSDLLSASIISESATLGDFLSTTFFAVGHDRAEDLASEFGVRVILLSDDLEVTDLDGKEGQIAVVEE